MTHRGRLNPLVNIIRKPIKELLSELDGKDFEDEDIDGDGILNTDDACDNTPLIDEID